MGPGESQVGVSAVALAQIAATGLAGVFAGAATYISLAQQPALEETDELQFQAPFFRRMYFYAARMHAPLAIGSGISALAVYFLQRNDPRVGRIARLWLYSGSLMGAIAPYTIVRMLALNLQLIDTKNCRKRGSDWMHRALVRWGELHRVRAYVGIVAFTGMLVAMACNGQSRELPAAIH